MRYLHALVLEQADYTRLLAAAHAGEERALARAEAALAMSNAGSLASADGIRACGTPGATIT